MAIFSPTIRLSSVDLPALGRPIKDTKPDFIGELRGKALTALRPEA
jgi:hypothetical protein